jgi:hypothetical protein
MNTGTQRLSSIAKDFYEFWKMYTLAKKSRVDFDDSKSLSSFHITDQLGKRRNKDPRT